MASTRYGRPKKKARCKICGRVFIDKAHLVDHIDRSHKDQIPGGWSAARYECYLRTGKAEGKCIYCGKPTGFNEKTGKYFRLCKDPKCRKAASDAADRNMIGKFGKTSLLDDPDQQRKMVYARKNSGTYTFVDPEDPKRKYGVMYDSSYGKDFLEMLDNFLMFSGQDIIGPSPHTYYYEYERKKHFYIPDFYIPSLNLEIEIKDGGANPNTHPKIQAVDKVKEKLKDELKANFDVLLSEYPSGMRINSLLIAKYFHIKKDYVVVGNGAAELIKVLMEGMEGKIGVILPTFEEYPNRSKQEQLVCFTPENRDFSYTAADLMGYFADKDISNLVLVNPDNPSGNFIPYKDLLKLIEWTKQRNIRIIVDESFVDFSEGYENNTLLKDDVLERFPNLVVMKSISKSYGVPGLRLGVLASSNTTLINRIRKEVAIWNINSFAEFYMQIFGKYEGDYKKASALFIEERARFYKELQEIPWLRVIPSQANYFLCEVIEKYTSHDLMKLLLMKHNLFIKDCSTKKGFNSKNYIRIAIRTSQDNDKMIGSLKKI